MNQMDHNFRPSSPSFSSTVLGGDRPLLHRLFHLSRRASLGLSLFLLMPAVAVAGEVRVAQNSPTAQNTPTNTYPPEEIQAYMDSCLSTATANGLTDTVANNYCTCTITNIQSRFTYAEFVGFAQTIQSTQQLPQELVEVVQLCTPTT